jgi:norsolorinic acid ketoreductase
VIAHPPVADYPRCRETAQLQDTTMSTVVLITGGNRGESITAVSTDDVGLTRFVGIGKGLVAHYLAQPDTTVIATAREVSYQNASAFDTLQRGDRSRLLIVQLSVDVASSIAEAASVIEKHHHIHQIDIVISNAGICDHWGPVLEMRDADVLTHFQVNTLGPLRLFQALAPLLNNASSPKFIYISTALASISGINKFNSLTAAYGMSKAAGNYLMRKINAENGHLITLSIDPG